MYSMFVLSSFGIIHVQTERVNGLEENSEKRKEEQKQQQQQKH